MLAFTLAATAAVAVLAQAAEATPPSVILIVADDLGPNEPGSHGVRRPSELFPIPALDPSR